MDRVNKLLAVCVVFNFLVVSSVLALRSFDYCSVERTKCKNRPHIGCNKRATFKVNKACNDIKIIPMSQSMKNTMVQEHNRVRNKLALGKVPQYPAASRMLEMSWDDELEATACEHIKYCQFDHDQCRATPSYDHPGQNLRKSSDYLETVPNYNYIIEDTVNDWFEEYSNVNPSIVDRYSSRGGKMYGHFTVMSREVNDRVGCCMMEYKHYERQYWWKNTFVTCNYRETNFIGEPIYYRGPAASQCNTWGNNFQRSSRYPGLCTEGYSGKWWSSNNYDPYVAASSQVYEETVQFVTAPSNFSTYCQLEKKKCKGKRHIGCEKNDEYFALNQACANTGKFVPVDGNMKQTVLDTHNSLRDSIAGGGVETYPSASKMLEMTWDNELADVACDHVKYCQTNADECRSTASYDQPGQNTKLYSTTNPQESVTSILQSGIFEWFGEYNNTRPTIIDSYVERNKWGSWNAGTTNNAYSHFTVMVKENNDKVGCCYIKYTDRVGGQNMYNHLFTCNYRQDNQLYKKTYTSGEPQSQCYQWGLDYKASDRWSNLCTTSP